LHAVTQQSVKNAASSANRVVQQLGGVLGTVVLALVLQNASTRHALPTAFGHTFAWAVGLTIFAIVPALALPGRGRDTSQGS